MRSRMRELMEGVQQLRDAAPAFSDFKAPQAVLKYVDEGGHPDDYVRELVQAALRDNRIARGRAHVVERLRDKLLAEADSAFPDATAAYRAVASSLPAAQRVRAEVGVAPAVGGGGGNA
ncbi:MAG: transcription factor subunit Med10 of mediator complex-domain-containing protein [Monoraphidium minutum]|nr:MAG: transcription factor subunit Med10 of mediator complex-domain-containing protein [Monoraphidium minutum]